MRIRNYRQGDVEMLEYIQQLAAQADGTRAIDRHDFETWLLKPELEARFNVFLVTDDDESNEWGQGGTLEGMEGEVIGYTILQLRQDEHAYHFLCEGAVHPQHRRRGAGTALLICALNRARLMAAGFDLRMERKQRPIYFEALLPVNDPAAGNLAARCEMEPTEEHIAPGMNLYRRAL
jgi:ribosomal protein S18 acetylase RimI-like enzyme